MQDITKAVHYCKNSRLESTAIATVQTCLLLRQDNDCHLSDDNVLAGLLFTSGAVSSHNVSRSKVLKNMYT